MAAAAATGWEKTAKAKRQSILDAIPEPWRIHDPVPSAHHQRDVTAVPHRYLTDREIAITEAEAEAIVQETSAGRWKAEEVTRAFAHRAAIAHQLVSCLHEIFFDAAIQEAQELDAYLAKHGKPKGPLHGLPISLKDQFHVKGVETTMGYVGWIATFQGRKGTGKERVFESEMVRELRNLGAVLYCKTSVPATLMIGETANNIIGYTTNPKNRLLSSGGSSGGEGALIALRGSVLGFGTDIGGSIRIPAAFCGQYGLRPSSGRLPYEGMANSMDGQNTVLSVVGPLSSSIGGLRLAVKSLLSQEPWLHDPLVCEMPWREDQDRIVRENRTSLTFGVLWNDTLVAPHPPVLRALQEVVGVLQEAGNKVIDWQPPSHMEAMQIMKRACEYDKGADIQKDRQLSGETFPPQIRAAWGVEPAAPETAIGIMENNVTKREYQKRYIDYWNSTAEKSGTNRPVDAVIMPVAPYAAAVPAEYDYYGYSATINVLDYASAVVPVTHADKTIDVLDTTHTPLGEHDKYSKYDANVYDGTPVAVQIVGRRLQEERVLALAEHVDQLLRARPSPQASSRL